MSSASSVTVESISRAHRLLSQFVENGAYEVGITEMVKVIFSDQVRTTSYDLKSKTIYINTNLANNYGKKENPTYTFFDLMPNKKESMRKHLEDVDLDHRGSLKTLLESEMTDPEIEAMLLHEIGHLFCGHVYGSQRPIDQKHKEIFDADLFAHASRIGRAGFFRWMKRQIVLDLLNSEKKTAVSSSLLSCESRLERALSYPYLAPNILKIKSVAQEKLEAFVQKKATEIGMPKPVTLNVVNEPDVRRCLPSQYIVELSRDLVENYGREDTTFDQILDQLPKKSVELAKVIDELNPVGFKKFQAMLKLELSTSEIEAIVLHELGHIKCAHRPVSSISPYECRKEELEADSFAYKNPEVKDGFIRKCKREILHEIIKRKKVIGDKLKTVGMRFYSSTHPSFEMRLKKALSYEAKQGCC